MPFPDRLKDQLDRDLASVPEDGNLELSLPARRIKQEREYVLFLQACSQILADFTNDGSEEYIERYAKLLAAILKDPDLGQAKVWVLQDLSIRIEEFLTAVVEGLVDLEFGLPGTNSDEFANLDTPEGAFFSIGLGINGKGKDRKLNKIVHALPKRLGERIDDDNAARIEYYSAVIGIIQAGSQFFENPGRYQPDPNRPNWKLADGPAALFKRGLEAQAIMMAIMIKGWWDPTV